MPEQAPNWLFILNICGWVITFLLGLIIALIKMENTRQDRRITLLENHYRELNNLVLGKYVDRDQMNALREDLVHRLENLNTKLDVVIMEGRRS
jgi:hypothetical protein